jgi:hypothetical protein
MASSAKASEVKGSPVKSKVGGQVLDGVVLSRVKEVIMVSQKDRDDYKEGGRDSQKGTIDQVVTDMSGNHPGTDSYYKGRKGEQLDSDKKK